MIRLLFVYTALLLTAAQTIPLNDASRLDLHGVEAKATTYKGSPALRVTETPGNRAESFAALKGVTFHNGTIDLDVAGSPAANVGEGARGFIGLAFHTAPDAKRFECFYIRPTNGRADDQLRRNHSTQYISVPDWPWERLRKESPGVYESWTDLVPGEWTHLRIVVQGTNASLYVGGAAQPCLLVHDLKLGDVSGGLALWIGPGTEGYFRNLVVQER